MTQSKETIAGWIEAVSDTGRGLTDWEEHFIESLQEQTRFGGGISDRQEEILERIYSEKTP